jgi:hypothetical protein
LGRPFSFLQHLCNEGCLETAFVDSHQTIIDGTRAMLEEGDFTILKGAANAAEVEAMLVKPVGDANVPLASPVLTGY